ncbi:uncharacterized protein Dwil_GK11974 [Drosophila willistoni]|uniref:Peptidase S1 domain-containing protein n=2 Tax=Drosophila willistoni TaxID=7260 RepID=B4N821_DROWI|nr:uncharacterized protein Dwil_GK11974 [Drosophila willistoni]
MTTHPRFKFLKGYDILVIRVSPKFPIDGKRFSIINFKDAKRRSTGLDAVLLGWGRLGNRPYKPKNLESIPFKTIDNRVCLQTYRFKYLTETEICAVHSNPKIGLRGACDGDSGAPLVDLNNNIIYGLLSYGRRACQPQKPYAFTRISAHVNWIQQQMANLMRNSGK